MKPLMPTLLYVHYSKHKKTFKSTHIFPSRKTNNYELTYFLDDSHCQLIIDDVSYEIHGDSVIFRKPGQYNQSFMPYESILVGFTFDPIEVPIANSHINNIPNYNLVSIIDHPLLNKIPTYNQSLKQTNYRQVFEDIYKESLLNRQHAHHYYSAKILELLYALYNERMTYITNHQQHVTNEYLIDALKYIEAHLSTNFTVRQMSSDLSLSERYIYDLFKKNLQVTPVQYINESKLNYAKNLLRTSNLSVQEISTRCGYENSTYFITLFRKRNGVTPLQYRGQTY